MKTPNSYSLLTVLTYYCGKDPCKGFRLDSVWYKSRKIGCCSYLLHIHWTSILPNFERHSKYSTTYKHEKYLYETVVWRWYHGKHAYSIKTFWFAELENTASKPGHGSQKWCRNKEIWVISSFHHKVTFWGFKASFELSTNRIAAPV